MESKGKTFRRLLKDEPYLFTGGIYSPLDAQIAEQAGMKSIYLSGYSMAMLNGWPDMGFLTMTEVAKAASMVASAVDVPIIADADDGYGNALSTMRTVQEFVKTGVAGIHLEDQRFPKRCGHIAGKTIVSREEAIGKYRAAARRARPARPRLRDHRAHRRLRRGGRQHGGGDLAGPRLRRRRRGPRLVRAVELGPRAGHRVRPGHEADASEPAAGLQLLVVVPLAQGPEPAHVPRAGRARLQVHLHHALRRPRRHVLGVERHAGAGEERGAGPVDARAAEGRPPDREPSRDGPGLPLPGARAPVHPGHRGADQGLGRLRGGARRTEPRARGDRARARPVAAAIQARSRRRTACTMRTATRARMPSSTTSSTIRSTSPTT